MSAGVSSCDGGIGSTGTPFLFWELKCIDPLSCFDFPFYLDCAGEECSVSCTGEVSEYDGVCEQSTFIITGAVTEFLCDAERGCQGTTITITDPGEGFHFICRGMISVSFL